MRCSSRFQIPDFRFQIEEFQISDFGLAFDLAAEVYLRFGTRNVFEIAEGAGLKIVFQKWFPVTFGEFEWRTKTIIVNENAAVPFEKIIAHELGHYFAVDLQLNKSEEEKFAHEFAEILTGEKN